MTNTKYIYIYCTNINIYIIDIFEVSAVFT